MNSNCVAFAADSTVTWKGGRNEKAMTRNNRQKLFSLPGRQPIAFMVSGSGKFAPNGLSWSRIFYKYNRHFCDTFGRETELETVGDYKDDFIGFLNKLVDPGKNETVVARDIMSHFGGSESQIRLGLRIEQREDEGGKEESVPSESGYVPRLQRVLQGLREIKERIEAEVDETEHAYKLKKLDENHGETIGECCDRLLESFVERGQGSDWEESNQESREMLLDYMRNELARIGGEGWWKQSKAQVTFGGFGSKDDYPGTYRVITSSRLVISSGHDSHVQIRDCNIIDPDVKGLVPKNCKNGIWRGAVFIEADAQAEFIKRITNGMDESVSTHRGRRSIVRITGEIIEDWIDSRLGELVGEVDGVGSKLTDSIVSKIRSDHTKFSFQNQMNREIGNIGNGMKEEFRIGVSQLDPLELANLALTLVELQAKVYRVVKPEVSVGLPVDVCYLSKEDGFVWLRRKNIPDREINHQVFSMMRDGSQLN